MHDYDYKWPHLNWLVSEEHDPTGEIERVLIELQRMRDINSLQVKNHNEWLQATVRGDVDAAMVKVRAVLEELAMDAIVGMVRAPA